jgi:PTS system nitrogen regulatory IIA component
MHIKEILSPANVVSFSRPPDKDELLRQLSRQAGAALRLKPDLVSAAIVRREELGSTGMGEGIAIPHARLQGVAKAFGVLARLEKPIDFAAIDSLPVDIVFLLLLPATSSGEQLTALACVTRQLRNSKIADHIRTAADPAEIYQAIAQ